MTKSGQILVVDDEDILREVLSTLLSFESYAVDLAENGAQALEMIREKDYGVMLLDLMMPDVDGFQVLEELKKFRKQPCGRSPHGVCLHRPGNAGCQAERLRFYSKTFQE